MERHPSAKPAPHVDRFLLLKAHIAPITHLVFPHLHSLDAHPYALSLAAQED